MAQCLLKHSRPVVQDLCHTYQYMLASTMIIVTIVIIAWTGTAAAEHTHAYV